MLKNSRIIWLLVAVGALVLGTAEAKADETVHVNIEANLRARPSERAGTIERLNEGQVVKILKRKGRWLQVSFRGKVGWITRTQIEEDLDDVEAREMRSDTRDRKSKSNLRRKDSSFDGLDEDARGEDGVTEDGFDDEDPLDRKESKKAKKQARNDDDEEEEATSSDDEEEDTGDDERPKKVAMAKGLREGQMVTVKMKSDVRTKPSKRAGAIFEAKKGEKLKVVLINEDEPDFIKVEDRQGTRGWISKNALAMNGRKMMASSDEEEDTGDEEASSEESGDESSGDSGDEDSDAKVEKSVKSSKLQIVLMADLGLISKSQNFTSDGTGLKANYKISNSAPVVVLGGMIAKRFGKYDAGADGSYVRTLGGKGINVPNGAMGTTTLQWAAQEIDLGVDGGYHLSPKYILGARLGYHIGQIVVQDDPMNVQLPGERIAGIRVGATFRAPKLTDKVGAHAGLDLLVSGKLEQAPYKDGDSASVSIYFLNAGVDYAWKKHISFNATFTMQMEKFAFTGTNQRDAAATNSKRSDTQYVFGVGAGYIF